MSERIKVLLSEEEVDARTVSYTHLLAHET